MPDSNRSTVLVPGNPGKSAYDLAVSHGFQGSEQAWLDSLQGQTGPTTSLVNRGTWVSGSTYSPNDYVFHTAVGGVGTSVFLVIPRAPFVSVVAPATDTANWLELLSGTPWTVASRRIDTQYSITGGGDLTSNRTLNLVGDVASPGNNKVYGTDGSGNRTWLGVGAGLGDVLSDESVSVDSQLSLFAGTTGKHIKKSTLTGLVKVTSGVVSAITDNSPNWDTGFSERRQWDGGSSNLVAATGRTSLGLLDIASSGLTTNKTIWVDSANGNNGTGVRGREDLPFATIAGALGASGLASGDVIFLRPGTHGVTLATQVVLPAGVHLIGSGTDTTTLTGSVGTSSALVVPGTGSVIANITIDNSSAPTSGGGFIGCIGANTAFTSALVYNCHLKGGIDGFYFDKASVTGLQVRNCIIETFLNAVAHGATAPGTMEFRNCSITTTGTSNPASRPISISGGTWRFYECQLKASGSATENICAKVNGGTLELHNTRVDMTADGTTNLDLQRLSGTLKANNVVRPDGAALITSGTITNISRYTLFSDINGVAAPSQLGTGTPTISKALFGDGTWKTPTLSSITDPTDPTKTLVFNIAAFATGVTRTLKPAPGADSVTVVPQTLGVLTTPVIQPMTCKGVDANGLVVYGYPDSSAQTTFTGGHLPNNYDMPGGTGYYQFWNSSAPINVTGIAVGQLDGMTFLITNSGTSTLTFKHESTSSTNVNRFHMSTGADIALLTDQEIIVRYDASFGGGGTAQRWRVTPRGSSGGGGTPGGSSSQLQWNSSGAFAGISTLTTDGTIVTQKAGSNYLLVDPTDPTKKFKFDASNITTATTRTINVPDANSTLAQAKSSTGSQWLTAMSAQGVFSASQPAFTDISGTATDAQVPDILTLSKISNLTTNGFVKTGSADGTLSIDTNTYLTGNQSITLTGDTTGSGSTSIATTTSGLTGQVQLLTVAANTTSPVTTFVSVCNSSGTPANGFGQKFKFQLEDSTTNSQDAGQFGFEWTDATHASRTAKFTIACVFNGGGLSSDLFNVYGSGGASLNADVDPGAGILNVNTGFRIGNAATTAHYLRGPQTNYIDSAIQAGDVPTLNQNTTGSAASLTAGGAGLLTFTGMGATSRVKTIRDAADTILELAGSYTPTGTWTNLVLATPNIGTPSAGTLTNCSGLPVSGITASTSTALGVGSIEIGHASDTTIARVGAGQISVEGVNVVTTSSTDTLTNKTLTSPVLSNPSTSAPSLNLGTGGSLKTSPAIGDIEADTKVAYYTHATGERGVLAAIQWIQLTSTYTLTSQTAAQKLFNSPTNGQVTVAANTTYEFYCQFDLSSMSATSGSFGFALGGTATQSSIKWRSIANKAATISTAGTIQGTMNTTNANTGLTSNNTATAGWTEITGTVRITTGGTLIPQVSLGVAATAVVGVNSKFGIWPVGSDTATSVGNWT